MNAESGRDRGVVASVEMMFLVVFALAAVMFLGFLGRLHAAGVQVTNTSQAAARAASLSASSGDALVAARQAVETSTLMTRCEGGPDTAMSWQPSRTGSWQGGSVTVTVRCTVDNQSLSGVWTPGSRTISASDTQPIDRYKR
ncbi:MAG: pilus assembly protein TadE [Ilumatobacteraceae bacterium]